ncbi:MAG: phytoene desaturase family protein [Terriglobales bacterium]
MADSPAYDAVVIGSGPNGLAAAVELARSGWRVVVFEAEPTWGGGTRSQELTLPGFVHDLCSAVHPMAVATSYLRSLPLDQHGLHWIEPPLPLAHPFDDGSAAVLEHSIEETARRLGRDATNYISLIKPVVSGWDAIESDAFGPMHLPQNKLQMAIFARNAIRSPRHVAERNFANREGRALFAGMAAHAVLPLEAAGGSAIALMLMAAAHRAGWPFARSGSQAIADALVSYLRSLGGEVVVGKRITSLAELPAARAVLCDLSPQGLADVCRNEMPGRYRRALSRFRRGPGLFKMDWALRGPIPWKAAECAQAGTVHLGGTLEEIAASEASACARRNPRAPEQPFVLLSQPSRFDPSRAPAGQHTAWAYCHVPNGSEEEMTGRIEAQIERFAPGFGELVLARRVRGPRELERHNANLLGGDVTGGANNLLQLLRRPTWRAYRTPMPGIYLCSASTPPGGGVHGLCGYQAARCVLRTQGRIL